MKIEKLTAEIEKLEQQNAELIFKEKMLFAIARYNTKNPTRQINMETVDYILSTGLKRHQIIADKVVMLDSGGRHYKDNTGFGSMENWLKDEFIPNHGFVIEEPKPDQQAHSHPNQSRPAKRFVDYGSNPDHAKMIDGLRSRGISGLDR